MADDEGKARPNDRAAQQRERLAEAMRANLRRRKAQQRGRAVPEPHPEPVEEGRAIPYKGATLD